jgi:diadenylate cyclase
MIESAKSFISDFYGTFNFISLIDIVITSFLIYKVIGWLKGTQAYQVAKGIIFILIISLLSDLFNFVTINYILNSLMTAGLLALVIIFQPEMRRFLDRLGSTKFVLTAFRSRDENSVNHVISELVEAIKEMSETNTGALIIVERDSSLSGIIKSGVSLDAKVSKNLLLNIFFNRSPMHDGAVIISSQDLLLKSAGCILPLTQNPNLNKRIGTRHRSALGISETTDCLALIVSEETGTISYEINGRLSRFVDTQTIDNLLRETLIDDEKKSAFKFSFFSMFKRSDSDKA